MEKGKYGYSNKLSIVCRDEFEEHVLLGNDSRACGPLLRAAIDELERLHALINEPHTHGFLDGVELEAAHQRERWGTEHDAGKTPADWFWLVGYLAGKALHAVIAGNLEKAKHHMITTAAALNNWFLAINGVDNSMRPGIEPPKDEAA
jgi:hypothetical protein